MLPADRCVLLLVAAACNRQPAAAGDGTPGKVEPPPLANQTDSATGGTPLPVVAAPATPGPPDISDTEPLAPDEGLTRVEPLRPGPDEVDRALLLRLRRHAGAAVKIEALIRSGDAWLVAYTWDEIDAWWRGVHREGTAAEVRADLRRERLACEAALRHPGEDATGPAGDGGTTGGDASDDLDPDPEDAMDERSCWERALGSLAPREGPIDEACLALSVVRVTDPAIEDLWSHTGDCVEAPAAFELVDVAGAGWPQLVLQVRAAHWDMTRLGFQHANTTARLVVLDPRKADDAVMLEQIVAYATHVDESWHWEGSYAHITFKRGRHVSVLEQDWRTSDDCDVDEAGWAVADPGGEDNTFTACTVDWTVTRTPWDPAGQRWSGKAEELPRPKRLPVRDRELPIALPGVGR